MVFVSACSWLALVTSVGGYVLAGVEIGVLCCTYLSIFVGVGVVSVCVCLYTRVHTHKLLGYLMSRCGMDTWRARRIQID